MKKDNISIVEEYIERVDNQNEDQQSIVLDEKGLTFVDGKYTFCFKSDDDAVIYSGDISNYKISTAEFQLSDKDREEMDRRATSAFLSPIRLSINCEPIDLSTLRITE